MVGRVRCCYQFELQHHHGYPGNARLVGQMKLFEEPVEGVVEAVEMARSDGMKMSCGAGRCVDMAFIEERSWRLKLS